MAADSSSKSAQLRAMLKLAREYDSGYLPKVLGASLGAFGLLLALGFLVDHPIILGVLGALVALVLFTIVTGRSANAGALASLEGQPGAAYAVLSAMRGDWRVTPMVAMTRSQEVVHRVVGRPGVILVAEGAPTRARDLMTNELRKTRRVIGDTPLYDVVVGDADGQVPLRRLQMHLMKLPRNLKPREVNAVEARLKAVGAALPIPKGPLPKGVKIPKGGKPR